MNHQNHVQNDLGLGFLFYFSWARRPILVWTLELSCWNSFIQPRFSNSWSIRPSGYCFILHYFHSIQINLSASFCLKLSVMRFARFEWRPTGQAKALIANYWLTSSLWRRQPSTWPLSTNS